MLPGTCCRWCSDTRMVLRHGAAGAGRTGRAADLRGPGGLGGRPGQPGGHRGHRAGRPARHGPDRPGAGHRGAAAGRDPPPARPRRGERRDAGANWSASARSACSARWRTCCSSRCSAGTPGAQVANLLALAVTAVGNTALNRRVTFGVRGAGGAARHHAQGLIVFALGLLVTSGSLALLGAVSPHPARAVEMTVLVIANLTATVLRFVLLRSWVFGRTDRKRRRRPAPDAAGPTACKPTRR